MSSKVTSNEEHAKKIVLVKAFMTGGAGAVGASKLFYKLVNKNSLFITANPDLNFGTMSMTVQVNEAPREVKIAIYKLKAECRDFTHMSKEIAFKNNDIGLFVTDITNPRSVQNLPSIVQEYLAYNDDKAIPLIVIRNKIDLVEETDPDFLKEADEAFKTTLAELRRKHPSSPLHHVDISAAKNMNLEQFLEILEEVVVGIMTSKK